MGTVRGVRGSRVNRPLDGDLLRTFPLRGLSGSGDRLRFEPFRRASVAGQPPRAEPGDCLPTPAVLTLLSDSVHNENLSCAIARERVVSTEVRTMLERRARNDSNRLLEHLEKAAYQEFAPDL